MLLLLVLMMMMMQSVLLGLPLHLLGLLLYDCSGEALWLALW